MSRCCFWVQGDYVSVPSGVSNACVTIIILYTPALSVFYNHDKAELKINVKVRDVSFFKHWLASTNVSFSILTPVKYVRCFKLRN